MFVPNPYFHRASGTIGLEYAVFWRRRNRVETQGYTGLEAYTATTLYRSKPAACTRYTQRLSNNHEFLIARTRHGSVDRSARLPTRKSIKPRRSLYGERKCADTIGTVLVLAAGHFQMLKFSNEIYESTFTEKQSETVMV